MQRALRADRTLDLPGITSMVNVWSKQDHRHGGRPLWGSKTFSETEVARMLSDGIARQGTPLLREQVVKAWKAPPRGPSPASSKPKVVSAKPKPTAKSVKKKPPAVAKKPPTVSKKQLERDRQLKQDRRVQRDQQLLRDRLEASRKANQASAVTFCVDYFTQAGIPVHNEGGVFVIGKRRFEPENIERARLLVDAIVQKVLLEQLKSQVIARLALSETRPTVGAGRWRANKEPSLVITESGRPLASVRGTEAETLRGRTIIGNFLTAGTHWDTLIDALQRELKRKPKAPPPAAKPKTPAVPPAARAAQQSRYLTAFPEGLNRSMKSGGVASSRRLREDRSLVFGHTIEVETPDHQVLRFEVLQGQGNGLQVPFRWIRRDQQLRGAIRLLTPSDPLGLLLLETTDDAHIGRVWVLALAAYARLVCHADLAAVTARRRPAALSTPARPRTARSVASNVPRASSRAFDGNLVPIGNTRRWLASYVVGHRRRLRPGQRASDKQRALADRVGIRLRAGETWVAPFVRGLPGDAVLRFRWSSADILLAE
jgi:hypothetical protein